MEAVTIIKEVATLTAKDSRIVHTKLGTNAYFQINYEAIDAFIEKNKMTKAELSRRVFNSSELYSSYRSKKTDLKMEVMQKIADILGCEPTEFLVNKKMLGNGVKRIMNEAAVFAIIKKMPLDKLERLREMLENQ